MYRVSPHLDRLALSLLAGATLATLAVNLRPDLYYDLIETRLLPDSPFLPLLTPQVLITQGLMALFLFVLGKEFFESLRLEGGLLAAPAARRLLAPTLAGALLLPLALWTVTGQMGFSDLPGIEGWSLCLGADLALAWTFGRRLFGQDHPALPLLLFLAVALDMIAAGGIALERLTAALLALLPSPEVYDSANRLAGAVKLLWLLPAALAPLIYRATWGHHAVQDSQRQHRRSEALTPILITALITWGSVLMAGLPAALALLPMIPMIPHAPRSLGLFAEAEALLHDPLNRLESLILPALPVVVFLFGLTAGGIDFGALGPDTARTLGALALRPVGLVAGAVLAIGLLGASLPQGMRGRDLILVALLLTPGLTLPLLALDQGLGGGGAASGARAGLAMSLLFGPLALSLGRLWRHR
ncbi:Na+/H+ antiporter NhaA [Rhodobacter sp. KR11]|uniref:Na+/H+ antiporter NhaA n=1 Tax=Rhodobacter sp. KR11 TaxID=2974588 RepID=UPI0022225A70|nr:Na+/H+ antiporter NhaA [Rhodobacter sp. KR11]MCW1919292.1 Na+/H+ antiporter NhaA [Rhodobacter sp. KR11]